ncbi:cytochrome-c peroxidase [Ochrovirga pacifica]|uniref:cytochrome-c peroxidase n=1 Tax=Ochrovirga pacifica TaxID=1042376 RepID=UPI0002557B40|nr:cytochrome c peroxidase [Ochrovirga pacifica]
MKFKFLILTGLALIVFTACFNKKEKQQTTLVNWDPVQQYYLDNLDSTLVFLKDLDSVNRTSQHNITVFKKIRTAFKKCEPYLSYLNPKAGHRVNGPALPVFRENSGKILPPVGLQTLEESIFLGETSHQEWVDNLQYIEGTLSKVKSEMTYYELNAQRFFLSTHQQLLRIVSFSMANFDTPVSQWGVLEAEISLQSLLFVYQNSIQKGIQIKDKELDISFVNAINKAVYSISSHSNPTTFDKFDFIKNHLNPITRLWVAIRKKSDLWQPNGVYPFNLEAPTFFEENSWDVNHFAGPKNQNATPKQIALGKKLFYDANISKTKDMACVTCHDPKKGYADGIRFSLDNSGKPLSRNSPTLINSIFQKAFFWDGKSGNLNEQISNVFQNDREFNSSVHQFSDQILVDTTYIKLFKEAYGKIPKSNQDMVRAIASYVGTLNGFSAKFDKNIRGEEDTFTASEKRGFNLFMGKALCATCHFMPLTNGTVPPFFTDTEKEAIGVPKTNKNKELDADLGFYHMFQQEYHKTMFKTPTVRNIALTAPYMHNGVYNTLEEVMDFYNQGGGAGLGFNLPHQTLPFDELNLSEIEIIDIIAFLNTLTDVPEEAY